MKLATTLASIVMASAVPCTHGFTDAFSALALGCFTEFGTCCRYVCASPQEDMDNMVSSLACAIREKAGNKDWGAEVGYLEGSGDYENIDEEYCFYLSSFFEMDCACDPNNPIDNPVRGDTCGSSPPNFEKSFDRGDFNCCSYESMYKVEPGWSQIGLPKENEGCCPERMVSTETDGNLEYIWPRWSCNLLRGYCCYDDEQADTKDCRGSSTWKTECAELEDEGEDSQDSSNANNAMGSKLTVTAVMLAFLAGHFAV